MFFIILFIIINSFVLSANVSNDSSRFRNLAKKINDDSLIKDLFNQEQQKELLKIEKNKTQLKLLEVRLKEDISNGLVDDESCIRNSISVLRTINYVYTWIEEQLQSDKQEKVRLATFNNLARIQYLNTIFQNSYLLIEECRLQNTQFVKREMIKDVADSKVEKIKEAAKIPKHFEAAIVPFR